MSRRGGLTRRILKILRGIWTDCQKFYRSVTSVFASLATLKEEPVSTGRSFQRNRLKVSNYFNPIFWLIQSFWFLARYFTSRELVAGLQGLPALAGVVAPLLFGIWLTPSIEDRVSYARSRMSFYVEREEFDKADFFSKQACALAPGDPAALLARAVLLDKKGEGNEGLAIAVQLGNVQKYLPAVEWLTEKELKAISDSSVPDEQRDKRLTTGLNWILQQQPDHLKANLMLGTFHMLRGQFTNALPPLRKVTKLSRTPVPEAYFSIAVVERNLGEFDSSKAAASIASDGFIERNSREPYSLKNIIQTLRALVMSEREPEAVAMLLQILQQRNIEDASEIRWLLGDVYAQWSKRLRTNPQRSTQELAQAVDLMQKAIAAAPNHPGVTEELVSLTCMKELDDVTLESQLQVALNSGIAPSLVHFIKGTRELLSESPDPKRALQHFEIAAADDDYAMPGLLNNLADAMVETDSEDLDGALILVDQAIALMPNQPYFHDTRGKILLKQGQPVKAISDFEKALAAKELRGVVHEKLADAYEIIGDTAESKRHRQMAAEIKKKQEE